MLRGSDSETSVSDIELPGSDEEGNPEWTRHPVLRQATLTMQDVSMQEAHAQAGELMQIVEAQRARLQALEAQVAGEQARAASSEWVQIQAAISADIRNDIVSVGEFSGDLGDLNHFVRSGDDISRHIAERLREGRLDPLAAASLQHALVRRVHRAILNRIQADEGTPWEEVRRRLQKEYGGGRWTPQEDAVSLIRMTRGPRQTKGDFAAALLRRYTSVVEKYREALPGPEANAKLEMIEELAKVPLGEALGATITGSLIEEATRAVDAAEREEARDGYSRRMPEWRPRGSRQSEVQRERPRDRGYPREERRRGDMRRGRRESPGLVKAKRPDERKCFGCGKRGHIQARCPTVKCFECGDTGHLARACPYLRPKRRSGVEPMEVNHHRLRQRTDRRRRAKSEESDTSATSGGEEGPLRETSDSEHTEVSYATVVRRGKPKRRKEEHKEEARA